MPIVLPIFCSHTLMAHDVMGMRAASLVSSCNPLASGKVGKTGFTQKILGYYWVDMKREERSLAQVFLILMYGTIKNGIERGDVWDSHEREGSNVLDIMGSEMEKSRVEY